MSRDSVIKVLTGEVLSECADDESLLLADYSTSTTAYGSTSRGAQGVGLETAVFLLLPVVYKFFEKFLEQLAANMADGVTSLLKEWLSDEGEVGDKLVDAVKNDLLASGVPPEKAGDVAKAMLRALNAHKELFLGG